MTGRGAPRKEHRDGLKCCNECKTWKPLAEFFGDKSRWDGLNARCKECGRARQRKYPAGEGHRIVAAQRRAPHNGDGEKRCRQCGEWKALILFEKKIDSFDGVSTLCKACANQNAYEGRIRIGRPRRRGSYRSHVTPERRAELSQMASARWRGTRNPNWKDGTRVSRYSWRFSPEYRSWRKRVFQRDGFHCQDCGKRGNGDLNAHHRLAASTHPELRYELDNGITLCRRCHSKVHGSWMTRGGHSDASIKNRVG